MIDEREALEIARARASNNGWAFGEPVAVLKRRGWFGGVRRYDIETNHGELGTKARFVIDARTGAILEEGYVAR